MTQAHLDLAVGGITSTHSSRVTAVDGLRAIAVAGVIAFHYQLGLGGGFLGVDLFFVISGYVITRALIHEQRTDAPSMGAMLSGFWKRRFRRIFAALATVLAAVTLWSWVLPNSDSFRRAVGTGTLAALVSGSNWWEIYGPSGYWSLEGDRNPLAHLWSLGVEEQFYLFFPLVFLLATLLLNPTLRWKAAVVAAGVAYAWAAWLGVERITEVGVDRIYLGTDTRCGALLLGCALAWYLEQHRHRAGQTLRAQTAPRWSTGILRILSVIALGTLAALWSIAQVNSQWFFVIMLPLAGVAATILIGLLVTAPQSILARALSWAPLVLIGRWSYALYLWHWPIWVLIQQSGLQASSLAAPVSLLLTCMLTISSYYLIELPIMRRQFSWLAINVVVGAVTILLATMSLWTLKSVQDQDQVSSGPIVTTH